MLYKKSSGYFYCSLNYTVLTIVLILSSNISTAHDQFSAPECVPIAKTANVIKKSEIQNLREVDKTNVLTLLDGHVVIDETFRIISAYGDRSDKAGQATIVFPSDQCKTKCTGYISIRSGNAGPLTFAYKNNYIKDLFNDGNNMVLSRDTYTFLSDDEYNLVSVTDIYDKSSEQYRTKVKITKFDKEGPVMENNIFPTVYESCLSN